MNTTMLEAAKQKGIYTDVIQAKLGPEKLDIPDSKCTVHRNNSSTGDLSL